MPRAALASPRREGRGRYLLLLPIVIAAGLGSRRFGPLLPELLATYAGDILWGTMFVLIVMLIAPRARPARAGILALAITWGIELSQLYRAPWIDAVRATGIGGLILGHGFLWSDIVCCAIGVALGIALVVLPRRLVGSRRDASPDPLSVPIRTATTLDDISLRR